MMIMLMMNIQYYFVSCFISIFIPSHITTGTKMRRILKLNQHYILSIKNGSEISKYYHYREVRRIWIEKGHDK